MEADENKESDAKETEELPIEPLFEWNSPEFSKKTHSKSWYLIVILVALAMMVGLFFVQSWSGMALVAVAVIFICLVKIKPKDVECALYENGLVVDQKVFQFTDFVSFSLDSDQKVPRLRLRMSGRLGNYVVLPLGNIDAKEIYSFVSGKVPESKDHSSDVVDLINRIL